MCWFFMNILVILISQYIKSIKDICQDVYIDDDIMIEKKRIIKRKLLKLFNHNYQPYKTFYLLFYLISKNWKKNLEKCLHSEFKLFQTEINLFR